MTAFRVLQQGIAAVQAGKPEEGARLLRLALREPVIAGSLRAIAYMWLAETTHDPHEKITCYTEALSADPTNELAQQRLTALLTPPASGQAVTLSDFTPTSNPLVTPPPPPPVYQPPGVTLSESASLVPPSLPPTGRLGAHHIVGVFGSGQPGSGFFMTRSGIVATTRSVVGSRLSVTVVLSNKRQFPGQVVRSFPELDVAFVHVNYSFVEPIPFSPDALIPSGMLLKAFSYTGQVIEGSRRETGLLSVPHWFPTDIIHLPDAGGNPVLDDQGYLVGMLTRNTSSATAYVFGLHISALQRCLEQFTAEMRSEPNRIYCSACGGVSRAAGAGGPYCDLCGALMPHAADTPRLLTAQIAKQYGENTSQPCPACAARVGFYQGRCLRCGRDAGRPSSMTPPLTRSGLLEGN